MDEKKVKVKKPNKVSPSRNQDWQNDPDSILNTNSTLMSAQEEEPKKPINWRAVLTVVIVVVALVGLIVGGIFVSDAVYKKQKWETERKELRDGAEPRYITEEDLPEYKDGELDYGLTAMYYTKEDGMWMHVSVCNGLKEDLTISRIGIVLTNSKKQEEIANGESSGIEWKVAAGETKSFEVYFPPEFVKIKDDTLKEISPEVTIEYQSSAKK